MKKFIALILATCLVFSASFTAFATTPLIDQGKKIIRSQPIKTPVLSSGSNSDNTYNMTDEQYPFIDIARVPDLCDDIHTALSTMTDYLDVEEYNLKLPIMEMVFTENNDGYYNYNSTSGNYVYTSSKTGSYNLATYSPDFYYALTQEIYGNPEFFNCGMHYCYFMSPSVIPGDLNMTVDLLGVGFDYYYVTKTGYNIDLDFCNKELDNIISLINPAFNDLEKIIFVHDYLAINYHYDSNDDRGNLYYFLSTGGGVCQSYAMTFKAIMDKLGIENTTVVSELGNHIWNIVKLNGKYYHIDCTHDDPAYNTSDSRYSPTGRAEPIGNVTRTYLLVDDNNVADSTTHIDWYTVPSYEDKIVCNSTDYNSVAWKTSTAGQLCYYDGYWYNISNSCPTKIYRYNGRTLDGKTQVAKAPTAKRMISNFNSRATVLLGNEMYFCDIEKIYKYNFTTTTGTITEVSSPSLPSSSSYLGGCYKAGGDSLGYYIHYDFQNKDGRYLTLNIGDINQDGYYNAGDLSVMIQMILDTYTGSLNEYFADMDFSRKVDILDLVLIKRKIALNT